MRFSEYDRIIVLTYGERYPEMTNKACEAIRSKGGHPEIYVGQDEGYPDPPPGWSLNLGCWRHLNNAFRFVAKAKADGLKSLLLVEDDLELTPEFDQILAKADIPPDWQLLYYGAMHCWAPTTQISEHILKLDGSVGFHCIGIKSSVFDAILNLEMISTIDSLIGDHLHKEFPAYAIYPSIAITTPCVSTITGKWSGDPDLWESKGTNH